MSKTELKARIQFKADTTTNWNNIALTPLKGELIAYVDSNETKIKIGDDNTALNDLPFVTMTGNYLPLTGGKITGTTIIGNSTNSANFYLQNNAGKNVIKFQSSDGSIKSGALTVRPQGWIVLKIKKSEYEDIEEGDKIASFVINTNNNTLIFESNATDTAFYERFHLPAPSTSLTENKFYDILTSKNIVTIAQGGTGTRTAPIIGGVIYGSNGVYASTSAGTSGQLLKSNGTSAPSWINQNEIAAGSVPWSGITGKPNYYDGKAITNITRDGLNFTCTYLDGTTSSFNQQDSGTKIEIIDQKITIEAIESDFYPENIMSVMHSIPWDKNGDVYIFADLDLNSATPENISDLLSAWNCVDKINFQIQDQSLDLTISFLRAYPKISFDVKLRIIVIPKI